jgi:tetratricopeptide (TPR) repeat protein
MDTWGARPYATFADPLLRDALYESLNFTVKRAFHARVAELLEHQGADEPRLWPPLARHFEAAGEDDKARHYLWNAAEDARAKYDNTSAFDFLGRYVALCERAGADPAEDVQFRKGLLYLAEASKELGRLDETDRFCQRILDASAIPTPETVAALMKVADNKRRRGDPQGALETYETAAVMARLLDDKIQQMNIILDSGVPLAMMGRFEEAMARFQKAEKLARKFRVYSSLVYALMNQGLCYYHGSSKCEQGLMVIHKARRVAARQRLRPMLMNVSVNLGQMFSDTGRYKEALAVVEEGIIISKQFGYRQFYLSMLGNRVLYETMLGMWDKARQSVDLLLTASRHHGMQTITANGVHALAILESMEGDIGAALAGQCFAAEVHLKMGARNDAIGCINEIFSEAEQWSAPRIADERLADLYRVLEPQKISSDAAAGVAFRAHLAYHDVLKGEVSISAGLNTIEEIIDAAKAQSSPWLLAEVGELYLRLARKCKLDRKVCKLASDLAEILSDTYCPQKVVPFFLTLAELIEQGCPEIQMQFVLKSLKRNEPVMDRGLTGIRYHTLLSRAAQRAGRKKVARERRERAVQIAQAVLALQKSKIYREAFLALPEVRDLLGTVE